MEHIGYSSIGVMLIGAAMRRAGVDARRELGRFGVEADSLGRFLTGCSPVLEQQLFRHMGHILADDAFSVHLGPQVQEEDFQLAWFLMHSQATVREAFEQAFALLRAINDVRWSFTDTPPVCRLEIRPASPVFWTPAMAEMRLSVAAWVVQRLAGVPVKPVAVHHSHAAPASAPAFERRYEAPVRFGQPVDALLYDAKSMDLPSQGANPLLARVLEKTIRTLIKPPPAFGWVGRVQDALTRIMPAGEVSVEAAARELGVPARTLVYQLALEEASFRQVLEDLRRDVAIVQTATPGMTAERLSALLGFGDARNFFRAFKRWTGSTPSQFSRGAAGTAPSCCGAGQGGDSVAPSGFPMAEKAVPGRNRGCPPPERDVAAASRVPP